MDALHQHGIFVHGNFITGLPGETPATVEQTLAGISGIEFDSVGGGPFYLTPGSTFERRPDKFGIRILDPAWRVRQHVNFYDPAHEYFATATLTQPQMKELAAAFRQQIEAGHAACWNLSDYALLCWLSAGGTATALTALWKKPEEQMTCAEQQVIGVLKEKDGAVPPDDAASFVAATRNLAAGLTQQARGW